MFEVLSKTGTKVKIINVTEARANFATVLSDSLAAYVITKNNKPQRVIISYEEFERLQNASGKAGFQNDDETNLLPDVIGNALAKESFSDLATQVAVPVPAPEKKRGLKASAYRDKQSKASQVKGLIQQRMGEALGEDYFGDSEVSTYGLEEDVGPLLSPDMISDEQAQEVRETLQQESGEHADFFSEAAQKEGAPKTAVAEEKVRGVTVGQTPEQAAYFQKYRKLYEGRQAEPETEPEPETPKLEEQTPVVQKQAPKQPDPIENHNQTTRATESTTITLDNLATQEDLPSLEDLLKGLDLDPSGEDKDSLSDQDINDLINRITND